MAKSFGYAAIVFGYVVVLSGLAFFFGGGGHGTALFGLIVLAPGSLAGDNPWALTGVLFWLVVGFLLGHAHRRGVPLGIALMLLVHYAGAVVLWTQEGRDGGAGFWLIWDKLPVLLIIFCLLYLAGNVMIWHWAFRRPRHHLHGTI
jgi:hypothetical protein